MLKIIIFIKNLIVLNIILNIRCTTLLEQKPSYKFKKVFKNSVLNRKMDIADENLSEFNINKMEIKISNNQLEEQKFSPQTLIQSNNFDKPSSGISRKSHFSEKINAGDEAIKEKKIKYIFKKNLKDLSNSTAYMKNEKPSNETICNEIVSLDTVKSNLLKSNLEANDKLIKTLNDEKIISNSQLVNNLKLLKKHLAKRTEKTQENTIFVDKPEADMFNNSSEIYCKTPNNDRLKENLIFIEQNKNISLINFSMIRNDKMEINKSLLPLEKHEGVDRIRYNTQSIADLNNLPKNFESPLTDNRFNNLINLVNPSYLLKEEKDVMKIINDNEALKKVEVDSGEGNNISKKIRHVGSRLAIKARETLASKEYDWR